MEKFYIGIIYNKITSFSYLQTKINIIKRNLELIFKSAYFLIY